MRILTKRALRFELDGQKVDTEPMLIMDVPEWVKKSPMWKLAAGEPGLISILEEKTQVRGASVKKEQEEK